MAAPPLPRHSTRDADVCLSGSDRHRLPASGRQPCDDPQRAELRNDRFGSVHDASEHLERSGRLGIPRAASIFGDLYWSRRTGGRHWRASGRLRDDDICRLDRDRPSPTAATAPRFVPASDQWVHRHDRRPSAGCNRYRRPPRRRAHPPADLSLSRDGWRPYFGDHVRGTAPQAWLVSRKPRVQRAGISVFHVRRSSSYSPSFPNMPHCFCYCRSR